MRRRSEIKKVWRSIGGVDYNQSGKHRAHKLFKFSFNARADQIVDKMEAENSDIIFYGRNRQLIHRVNVLREDSERFVRNSIKWKVRDVRGGGKHHKVEGEIFVPDKEVNRHEAYTVTRSY